MNDEWINDFTEDDVIDALDRAGLRHDDHNSRYIVAQCPKHEERNPSCQIFKDDWFALCHSGCGRFPISEALPGLKRRPQSSRTGSSAMNRENTHERAQKAVQRTTATKYKTFELYDEWSNMPPIPRDHVFKTIPLSVLDRLGWRYDAHRNAYYIPYFNERRDSLPFIQYRNLTGNIRFNFLKDAKPTVYGKWNLKPGGTYFLVEGTSDCAALEYCGVPWIGLPSASSGELVRGLATWAVANHVTLVYAGDNDEAGNKLREALDEVMPYRTCQPPAGHKDWADFLAATDRDTVAARCSRYYRSVSTLPDGWDDMTDIQKIQAVWPGAMELKIT